MPTAAHRPHRPSTGDLIAGLSVALVVLPQSLAYAELAGMPPYIGLFAAALPSLLAAAFVSSPYLQTGPVAVTALLTFGALQPIAEPFSAEYVELAALLALMVGGLRLAMGLARLGSLAYLLSEPVLVGFTTGAAVLIIASQLPKVLDVVPDGDGTLSDAYGALIDPGAWSWQAIVFSAITVAVMFGGRRIHQLFPGVLVVLVAGTAFSAIFDYSGSIVGDLDAGFVSLGFDFAWGSWNDLLIPAVAIAVVGFAEPATIARTFAAEERMSWNANREMFAQGVANVASAISGAFPVGGSFSRSSLNRFAGATSAWAGAITGAFVLVVMPFVGLLADLPRAILGAIVIGSVVKLVKLAELTTLIRQSRTQAVVGFGTLAATLAFSPRIERGVLVGVALSFAGHLWREMRVEAYSERSEDSLIVRPVGVLWFATVPQVDRMIRQELANHRGITSVVLDLAGVGRLDYTGGAAIGRLFDELRHAGAEVSIINVQPGSERAATVHFGYAPSTDGA